MKNILITGFSGYLGTRLTRRLQQKKMADTITGIDIKRPQDLPDNVSFYDMDIRDPSISNLLSKHEIDTLFHLAFVVKPIHNIKRMHDIDINGTKNILESTHRSGVKQVIAISSTLAYGAHPDNPKRLSEESPLRGNETFPYGYYKAVTDRLIQDFAKEHPDMAITILRPCTVFGPHIDNYISRMMFMPITVCVKGYNPPVQLVHEEDFVNACLIAAVKKVSGAFNITGDGTMTVKKIAETLGTKVIPIPSWMIYPSMEFLWRIHFPKIEVNRGYLDYIRYPFIASNKKAKKQLNLAPRYTTAKTLKQTLRHQRSVGSSQKKKPR